MCSYNKILYNFYLYEKNIGHWKKINYKTKLASNEQQWL